MFNNFEVTTISIKSAEQSTWNQIIELRRLKKDMELDHWLNDTLFTFNWWFLLLTTIGFIIIWLLLLDKKRALEIVTYGVMISSTGFFLDGIGVSLVLWEYPDKIIPVVPAIIEIHKIHLPIVYMIVYQYFSGWKSFFIAMTISAFIFSFFLESLLSWLGIYEVYQWKHIYSFPIYIFIGVVFKWILNKLKQIDNHY